MKKSKTFWFKFGVVTVAVGIMSPSVSIDFSQSKGEHISFSLMKRAEARFGGGFRAGGFGGFRGGGFGGFRAGGFHTGGFGAFHASAGRYGRAFGGNYHRVGVTAVRGPRGNVAVRHTAYGHVGYGHVGYVAPRPWLYGAGVYRASFWPGYWPAGAVFTGLAIGTIAASLPENECSDVYVNKIKYKDCSGTYFKPYYNGKTLQYKVVPDPH